jgi:hypothetical protein
MNDNAKVLELAEHFLLLQSQIEAIKEEILSQPNAPSRERLDSILFELESRIRNGQKHRGKSDEFQLLIQGQDDPATLIRLLHDRVLYTREMPLA